MTNISIGQPKGLFFLFFTEMWERFGFYSLQTFIILYMSQFFLFSDEKSYLIYGAFGSLIYFTPVVGGYIADRWLGFRHSIQTGGILLIIGYSLASLPHEHAFYLGLSLVIVGNGFFKPNVSSIVGELYHRDDPRRDSGFTIFYMGTNIGAMLPPLIMGFLVTRYGWHWGFLLAAIGMCIGMIIFFSGQKRLEMVGDTSAVRPIHKTLSAKRILFLLLIAGILIASFCLHFVFYFPKEADLIMILISVLMIFQVVRVMKKESLENRRNLLACLILLGISVVFWAFYSQMFTTLMLFANRNMTKQMLGLSIDAELTQFFNPFFIIALGPLFSGMWFWLARRNLNPSIVAKFSLAILMLAIGFLFLSGATAFFSASGLFSPWWLVSYYFFMTVGELLLSPIGLSMITKLSPPNLVGMMMGIWFLMMSAGFLVGSLLSTLAVVPKDASLEASLSVYSHAFTVFGLLAMAAALGSFLLIPYLKRIIQKSGV
jgi:proton-dependent oligopeptide transporter, POT family